MRLYKHYSMVSSCKKNNTAQLWQPELVVLLKDNSIVGRLLMAASPRHQPRSIGIATDLYSGGTIY